MSPNGAIKAVWRGSYHDEGRGWHRTREATLKRAGEMRDRKIRNLEKQIEKLRKMDFEDKP